MDFDTFVDQYAAQLDGESGPVGAAGAGEGTIGEKFRSAMRQVRDQAGSIPWLKLARVAAAVLDGILSGKTISEIVADVVQLLISGQI